MSHLPSILALVLAGGEGIRPQPLTADGCKPAVPIHARYRLVESAYRMDVRQMVDFHRRSHADAAIATVPVPLAQGRHFGIVEPGMRARGGTDFGRDMLPAMLRTHRVAAYAFADNTVPGRGRVVVPAGYIPAAPAGRNAEAALRRTLHADAHSHVGRLAAPVGT